MPIASSIKTWTICGIVLANKLYISVRPLFGQPKAHCCQISILIYYICEVDGTLAMQKCSLTQIKTDSLKKMLREIGLWCTYKMFSFLENVLDLYFVHILFLLILELNIIDFRVKKKVVLYVKNLQTKFQNVENLKNRIQL